MSILAIIAALAIEQWRPLGDRNQVAAALARGAAWLERTFNAGERSQGAIAWLVAVVPAAIVAMLLHALFARVHPLVAAAFDVGVLYLTLGFRQFSHYFTDINAAVKAGDLDQARALLSTWRGEPTVARSREEIIRLAVEEALLASHRHVYGVLLWYVLLPGPSGAVLYRLAAFLGGRWKGLAAFGEFAQTALYVIDWPAVRLTAAAFAVVGNFEDALYSWRSQARGWSDQNEGVVLASGAGALGVRLGSPVQGAEGVETRPELGVETPPEDSTLDSAVGLLWRALVFWLFVLFVISAASVLG